MNAEIVVRGTNRYTLILVPSSRDPSKTYRVDVVNKRCDCPAWKFQRGPYAERKMCKHLRSLGFVDAPVKGEPVKVEDEIEMLYKVPYSVEL